MEIHPLNAWTIEIDVKRNLLKHGKVNALLDRMEADALVNLASANKAYRKHRDEDWGKGCNAVTDCELATAFRREAKINKDAIELTISIRKYAPFIEVGAMTIAEAISCETQIKSAKKE